MKNTHELKDPIHAFIKYSSSERKVINSGPFQRLRHIHQLSLTYLVYPGATHRRFEHSLGVMELATRVFDTITVGDNITDQIRDLLPELTTRDSLSYWRNVVRMASLCHDIGHYPFSHVGEELVEDGWDHERMTRKIIESDEMIDYWGNQPIPLKTEDIVKLAVGPKYTAPH